MMKQLLKILVNITAQREGGRLTELVIAALSEFTKAKRIRVLDILFRQEAYFVNEKMSICDGQLNVIAERADDNYEEPISNYPCVLEGIRQSKRMCRETTAKGMHVLWLLVRIQGEVRTCFEISHSHSYDAAELDLIEGVFGIYCNYRSLLDYSERDALTGLFNRKTFDRQFSRNALALASDPPHVSDDNERRHSCETTRQWLAVVDIDHFKQVNDQFGHLYGDEVLILVANILRSSFRSRDRIFRFGGEEFVILLRSTTLDDAGKIFDRFRRHVEDHEFPQVGKVTVSLGFVEISQETPVVILGHADQALYHAKRNGRNRVCYYDELVASGKLDPEIVNNNVAEFF